jgi:hypothetical protein
MASRQIRVTIKADASRFVAALQVAARAAEKFAALFGRVDRHHRREFPQISRMHAAYDRRRRARRRRR